MAPKTFLVLFPFFFLFSHLLTGVYYPLQVVDLVVLLVYSISFSFSYCGSDLIGHHIHSAFRRIYIMVMRRWGLAAEVLYAHFASRGVRLFGREKISSYFSCRCLPEEELAVYSADLFICFYGE